MRSLRDLPLLFWGAAKERGGSLCPHGGGNRPGAGEAGKTKAGILATTGTVKTRLFQQALESRGLSWAVPSGQGQELVMSLIYEDIKAGRPVNLGKFRRASDELFDQGCDCVILGCTELSLVKRDTALGHGYLDALEVLSKGCVKACGAPLKETYRQLIS